MKFNNYLIHYIKIYTRINLSNVFSKYINLDYKNYSILKLEPQKSERLISIINKGKVLTFPNINEQTESLFNTTLVESSGVEPLSKLLF